MSDTFRPNLGKLLRVLVAGGMALVGGAGVRARAEEKPTPPGESSGGEKPAQGATQKDQEAQKAKADEKAKSDKKKADEKKKAEQSKKDAQPDGGGVKGW